MTPGADGERPAPARPMGRLITDRLMEGLGMPPREDKEPWHLDRKVPIALILTIIVQTSAIVWWAATTDSRLGEVERKTLAVERKIDAQVDDPVRLARLEGARDEGARRLEKIEIKLDRLLELWGSHPR